MYNTSLVFMQLVERNLRSIYDASLVKMRTLVNSQF